MKRNCNIIRFPRCVKAQKYGILSPGTPGKGEKPRAERRRRDGRLLWDARGLPRGRASRGRGFCSGANVRRGRASGPADPSDFRSKGGGRVPGVFRFVSLRRATGRFLLLVLAALALQGIPFLFLGVEGDAGAALYLIHLYGVIPLAAVLLPLWAGLGGVHPLAAFFPIGLALLLLPVYESTGVALLCMLLSLIAAVAGQEWKKRRETKKGNHHGGKAKKG